MRLKNFWMTLFAATLFVACSSDREEPGTTDARLLGERTYLTVRFTMSGNQTRADDDDNNFVTASDEELAVSRAYFYFFDKDFNACAGVKSLKGEDLIFNKNDDGGSVDQVSNPVIILEDPKEVPAYVIAVLNSSLTEEYAPATIDALRKEVGNFGASTSGNFMMSNSVYVGADGKAIYATPITSSNLYTVTQRKNDTADLSEILDALTPVVIPVERILAQVNPIDRLSGEKRNTGESLDGTEIMVDLKGWWVHNDAQQSYQVKQIDAQWGYADTWNDPANLRSYWATSYTGEGQKYLNYAYSDYVDTPVYTQENTDPENPTTLVVAAELSVEGEAVDLVKWRDMLYTADGYLTQVSNQLSGYYKLLTDDSDESVETYITFTPDDLKLVANTEEEILTVADTELTDYQVIPQVDATKVTAVYTGDNGTMTLLDDGIHVLNAQLKVKANVAQYWNGGRTYYFLPVSHSTRPSSVTEQTTGIVRNHRYVIGLNNVSGLGTPVPNPDKKIIPVVPADETVKSYIAAEVQILKYKIESQEVDLE